LCKPLHKILISERIQAIRDGIGTLRTPKSAPYVEEFYANLRVSRGLYCGIKFIIRQTPSIAFSIVDLPQFEPERLRYFVRSIQQQITLALHESGQLRLTDASIQGD
jgi:hypothetical protein